MPRKRDSVSSLALWLAGAPREKWDEIKSKAEQKMRAIEDFSVEQTAWREEASPAARRLKAASASKSRGSTSSSSSNRTSNEADLSKPNKRPQKTVLGPRDPAPNKKSGAKDEEKYSQFCLIDKNGNSYWYDGAPGLEAVKAEHAKRMKALKEKEGEEEKEKNKKEKGTVRFDLGSGKSPEKKKASKPGPQSDIPTITVTGSAESGTNNTTAKGAKSGHKHRDSASARGRSVYDAVYAEEQRPGSSGSGSSADTVRGIINKPLTPPANIGRPFSSGGGPPPAYESVYQYLTDAGDKKPHHTVYPVPGGDSSKTLPQPKGFSAFRPHKDVPPSLAIAPPIPISANSTPENLFVPDTPFLNQKSPETEYYQGLPDWSDLPSQRKVREQNRETYLLDKTTKSANSFDIFNPPGPRKPETHNVSAPQKLRTPPKIKRKPVPVSSPIFPNVGLGISETRPVADPSPPSTPSPVPAPPLTRRPRPPGWDQIQKWSGPNGSQASSPAGSVAGSVCGDAGSSASEYNTAMSGISSPAVSAAASDPYSVGSIPGKWAPSVSTLSETDSVAGTDEASDSSSKKSAANHVCDLECYITGCCADMVGDNKAFLVGTGYPPRRR